MRFNTRKLILAVASSVIILIVVVSLIYPAGLSGTGPGTALSNQAVPGSLAPSSNAAPSPPDVKASAFKGQGRLAFVCQGLLYVLDGQTGEVRQLTDAGRASQPAWSHDGEWLAFMRFTGPQTPPAIWLVRRDGTQVHHVQAPTAFDRQFSWSPTDDLLDVSGQNGVWLVPVTGEPRQLSDVPGLVAPDGKTLAYITTLSYDRNHPEHRNDVLYTVAVDGGRPRPRPEWTRRLAALRDNGIILVGWWPDGKGLLYWLDPDYSASAMADGVDLYSLRLGDTEPRLLTSGLGRPGWLSMFSRSSLLMVKGRLRIVWADKSRAMINVESVSIRDLQNPAGCVAIDPSLSADGTRIAFVAARDLGDNVWGFNKTEDLTAWVATRALWVENADGSGARPLASAGQGVYQPLWSKDGNRILYVKDNFLWLIGAGGGEPEKICGPLAYEDPIAGAFGYYGFISYQDEVAWFQP